MQWTCYLVDRVIGELAQFSEGVRQAESLWRSLSNHSIRRRALTADSGLKAPMKPGPLNRSRPSFVYFFQPFSRRRRLGFISTASRGPRNGRTFPASKLACRRRRACWNINAYSLAAHGNDGLGTTRMVAGTPGVCVVMSKSCTTSITSDLTVNGRNAGRFTMRLVTLP